MKKNYIYIVIMIVLLSGCHNKKEPTISNSPVISSYQTTKDDTNSSDLDKEESKEVSKEESLEESGEASKEESKEESQEVSQEGSKEESKVEGKEESIDQPKEPIQENKEEATHETDTHTNTISADLVDRAALGAYDNTSIPWGQGVHVDEKNRPVSAIDYQKKYGDMGGVFIGENKNVIYLTFDEGYEYPQNNSMTGNTARILDVLKEKKVKAVFFVTLSYVKANPDIVKRMIDEGHIVGNHSVTHPSKGLPSLSLGKEINEVVELHNYMLEQYQYPMYLFRYPAGIFSEQSLHLLDMLHYRAVFWSFAYRDWITDEQPDVNQALDNAVKKLHPGAIYLLHGVSVTNTKILGDFIDKAKEQNYEFKVIS